MDCLLDSLGNGTSTAAVDDMIYPLILLVYLWIIHQIIAESTIDSYFPIDIDEPLEHQASHSTIACLVFPKALPLQKLMATGSS